MRIAVIGASKGIGLATVREALARGHEVSAIARTPADLKDQKLQWFAGDARDAGVLARALAGATRRSPRWASPIRGTPRRCFRRRWPR